MGDANGSVTGFAGSACNSAARSAGISAARAAGISGGISADTSADGSADTPAGGSAGNSVEDGSAEISAGGSAGISAGGSAGISAGGPADDAQVGRDYRIGELARAAGITVRTLRYYQERKLLPPPRREGRIAWYSQAHLTRLRVIGQLLDRGHTLGGTGELLSAWEQGYNLAELLGVERAMTSPWSDEVPVPVTVADLSALLDGQLTPGVLEDAVRLGYVDVDGDRVIHVSHRLLDATTILVREGIPLPAILAAGSELQAGLDKMASVFVDLVTTYVLDRRSGPPPPFDVTRLAETIERLRPVARTVIDAEFARAMDRRGRATYGEFIRMLAARDRSAVPGSSGTSGASGASGASGMQAAGE